MLTTKKFIKEIDKLGFAVEKGGNGKYLWIKDSRKLFVAFVDTTEMYVFDTAYNAFDELQESDKKNLFNLLVKYTSTPHDEREDEKKYYLKHKWLKNENYSYLNLNTRCEKTVPTLCVKLNSDKFQTQFTQKEIEEIKERFNTSLDDFEQIPIEESEEF